MRRRDLVAALAAAAALVACASQPKVTSDVTPGANLAAYKTFALVEQRAPGGMDPVAFERIRQGVSDALVTKGYTRAEPGDLSVIVTLGARDKTDINTWGRFGRQVDVYQYTEGKMSVDVFDTKTRQPLWHSQATETIHPEHPDPAAIAAAVTSVMASFPPRA
jgi:hypothetical protein